MQIPERGGYFTEVEVHTYSLRPFMFVMFPASYNVSIFIFSRHTLEVPPNEKIELSECSLQRAREGTPPYPTFFMRVTVSDSNALYLIVVGEEGSMNCSL